MECIPRSVRADGGDSSVVGGYLNGIDAIQKKVNKIIRQKDVTTKTDRLHLR